MFVLAFNMTALDENINICQGEGQFRVNVFCTASVFTAVFMKQQEEKKAELHKSVIGEKTAEGKEDDDSQKKDEASGGGVKPSTSKETKVPLDPIFSEMLIDVGTSGQATADQLASMSIVINEFVGRKKM